MEPGLYHGMNLQFRYPENWTLSEETEQGVVNAVHVESPDHAIFAINRYRRNSDPDAILEEAVEAMLSEYENVEEEEATITVQGNEYPTRVVRFYFLDLLVSCQFVAIPDDKDQLLFQFQAEDRDYEKLHLVFQAMMHSAVDSLKNRDKTV
jgi:hypothetical protein